MLWSNPLNPLRTPLPMREGVSGPMPLVMMTNDVARRGRMDRRRRPTSPGRCNRVASSRMQRHSFDSNKHSDNFTLTVESTYNIFVANDALLMSIRLIANWTEEEWMPFTAETHADDEVLVIPDEVLDAWDKLIPRKSTLTQIRKMAANALVDVETIHEWGDLWLACEEMSESWKRIFSDWMGMETGENEERPKKAVVSEPNLGSSMNREMVVGPAKKVPEVPMSANQDFLDYAEKFSNRMQLAGVLDFNSRMVHFEAMLTEEWRTRFWEVYADKPSCWEGLVSSMLRGRSSRRALRKEVEMLRQRQGETAEEFKTRFNAVLRRYVLGTGEKYPVDERELYLGKLQLATELEELTKPDASIEEISRLAVAFEKLQGGHHRSKENSKARWPKDQAHVLKRDNSEKRERFSSTKFGEGKRGMRCHGCGETGHFRRECPMSKTIRAQEHRDADAEVTATIGNKEVNVLLDTGAKFSCATSEVVSAGTLCPRGEIQFLWGKTEVRSSRAAEINLRLSNGKQVKTTVWEVEKDLLRPHDIILSFKEVKRLGFWNGPANAQAQDVKTKLESKVDDSDQEDLEPLEWTPGPIRVSEEVPEIVREAVKRVPVATSIADLREPARVEEVKFEWSKDIPEEILVPRRRLSEAQEALLRERERELVDAQIYVPGDSSYASPWLVVPKPKGGLRDVVDMRRINTHMLASAWPVTDIEEIRKKIGGRKCLAEFDLKAAYWQIPIDSISQKRCAVLGADRLLEVRRLPMGARDSGAQLERSVSNALGLPGDEWKVGENLDDFRTTVIALYRDNLFLAADSWEELARAIRVMATKAKRVNLRFGSGTVGEKIELLGFEVTGEEWRPLRKALGEIAEMPVPTGVKSVRRFLGKCGYYRTLVKDYAAIAGPLEALLCKGVEWRWSQEEQEAFERMKKALKEEAVVGGYRSGVPTEVHVDASGSGVGACLLQGNRVVGYFSRRFKGAQKNWSVTRKEAFGVTQAVRTWRHLLSPRAVVWTDHRALEGWANGGGSSDDAVLRRWALWLQSEPVCVQWRPGSMNGIADQASRVAAQGFVTMWRDLPGNEEHRQARRYKWVESQLFYGQKQVPEIYRHGDTRRRTLIDAHVALGHATKTAMLAMLAAENIGWESAESELADIIDACDSCQRGESRPAALPSRLPGRRADWYVNDEWSMDLITDLPKTERGYCHLLVLTEAVSGFIETYPIRDRRAETVLGCLQENFWRFGYPRRLRSDRGNEFQGAVKKWCEELGITQKLTSSYHPQGDGQVERCNREIVDKLTRSGADEEWDLRLGSLMWSLRVRPSRRLGNKSSLEVLLGASPRVPMLHTEEVRSEVQSTAAEALETRLELIRETRREVSEALRRYEGGGTRFHAGDLVLCRAPNRKKFDPRWSGPHVVIEARPFSLQVKTEGGKSRVVSISDVKPYRGMRQEQSGSPGSEGFGGEDVVVEQSSQSSQNPPTNEGGGLGTTASGDDDERRG